MKRYRINPPFHYYSASLFIMSVASKGESTSILLYSTELHTNKLLRQFNLRVSFWHTKTLQIVSIRTSEYYISHFRYVWRMSGISKAINCKNKCPHVDTICFLAEGVGVHNGLDKQLIPILNNMPSECLFIRY